MEQLSRFVEALLEVVVGVGVLVGVVGHVVVPGGGSGSSLPWLWRCSSPDDAQE